MSDPLVSKPIMGSSISDTLSLQQNSNSSSEEETRVQILDEKKRKRMQSNRESAKRSRMRKQQHLDDLTAQINHLRKKNNELINEIDTSNQHYVKIEAENCVLRAQMNELNNRLESLNEISNVIMVSGLVNGGTNHDYLGGYCGDYAYNQEGFEIDDKLLMSNNPWNSPNYPFVASANCTSMLQY